MYTSHKMDPQTIVVIGGGIAGTTCAKNILQHVQNDVDIKVIVVTPKDVVKTAKMRKEITRTLTEIGVEEKTAALYQQDNESITIKLGYVKEIHYEEKKLVLESGCDVYYNKVCICTGAIPVKISKDNQFVISLRDTDTVFDLKKRLSSSQRIIVVGNGGIALELVYEVIDCEIIWCIKDESIGNTFFDEAAAAFLQPSLKENIQNSGKDRKVDQTVFKRKKYEAEKEKLIATGKKGGPSGSALGPDWSNSQQLRGLKQNLSKRQVIVKHSCTVIEIWNGSKEKNELDNVYIKLSNGEVIGADFVVSATGVKPNVPFKVVGKLSLDTSTDGGIKVNEQMATNLKDVYAAGDVCTPTWKDTVTWFPMKLWTQAWQMGAYAGKSIANDLKMGDPLLLDICFELFSHITTFFGYKVCLLGCYNGQKLRHSEYEMLLRTTSGVEFVKVILKNGRMIGCLLIGETDLEETFENLILNELDISFLGTSLLDPDVDIEDYFD